MSEPVSRHDMRASVTELLSSRQVTFEDGGLESEVATALGPSRWRGGRYA